MEIKKSNIGKTVYLVDKFNILLYEGQIIDVAETKYYNGTVTLSYKVETDAPQSYYKVMKLEAWQYKAASPWNNISFYFIKEQASKKIEELKIKRNKEIDIRLNTKFISTSILLSDLKVSPEDNIIIDLFKVNSISTLSFNQSQIKQLTKYLEFIDNLIKNDNELFFDSNAYFKHLPNSNEFEKVELDKVKITFIAALLKNKVIKMSLYVDYTAQGYKIIKWNKFDTFFHYNNIIL